MPEPVHDQSVHRTPGSASIRLEPKHPLAIRRMPSREPGCLGWLEQLSLYGERV